MVRLAQLPPAWPVQAIAAVLSFLVGLVSIASAWGFQLIGGYVPCSMCLAQRVPYYIGLPLALVTLVVARAGWIGVSRVLLVGLAALFIYGAGLGIWQAGAEWGFWLGPSDCGGGAPVAASATDLLAQLDHTRVVNCSVAALRIFGLSFAGWNVVVSVGLVLMALAAAVAPARPR